MFILKKGHQPGVYVPFRALFLVILSFFSIPNLSISLLKEKKLISPNYVHCHVL